MENYNYDSFGQCDIGAPDFRAVAKVGSQTTDFTLTDLDGNQVSLSSLTADTSLELINGLLCAGKDSLSIVDSVNGNGCMAVPKN